MPPIRSATPSMPFARCACGAWILSPGELQAGRCTACQRGESRPRGGSPVAWSFQGPAPAGLVARTGPQDASGPSAPSRRRVRRLPSSPCRLAQELLALGIQPQDVALAVRVCAAMQTDAEPVRVTVAAP